MAENTYTIITALSGAVMVFFAALKFWGSHKKKIPDMITDSIDASNKVQSEKMDRQHEASKDFFKLLEKELLKSNDTIGKLADTISGPHGMESRITAIETDVSNIKQNCQIHMRN